MKSRSTTNGSQQWPVLFRYGNTLFLALLALPSMGCDRSFKHIQIDPIQPSRLDVFVGKGNTIALEFHNENPNPAVDVFPEPPLTVRHIPSGHSCEIDGGVWVRRSVYLSADEATLLVQEYSGSNDHLVFYRTRSCKKIHEIEVSGALWKISGNELAIGHQCSGEEIKTCKSQQRLAIDAICDDEQTSRRLFIDN
ncbi:MAG: hypothetical protein AB1810_15970 [Pseudomonadota bacterium]